LLQIKKKKLIKATKYHRVTLLYLIFLVNFIKVLIILQIFSAIYKILDVCHKLKKIHYLNTKIFLWCLLFKDNICMPKHGFLVFFQIIFVSYQMLLKI